MVKVQRGILAYRRSFNNEVGGKLQKLSANTLSEHFRRITG